MTRDIPIPPNAKIIFPALCIVCGKDNPDSVTDLLLTDSKIPSAVDVTFMLFAGSAYDEGSAARPLNGLPACRECARRLQTRHRWQKIFNYVSWSLSLILAIALPVSLWWKAAVFVAFLVLPALVSVALPPAFDATILNGKATFHFTSEKFADEFIRVNQLEIGE